MKNPKTSEKIKVFDTPDQGDQVDQYWKILQFNIDWVRFSDTKATVIVTAYGLILTLIYTNAHSVYEEISGNGFLICLSICAAVCSISSLYFSFKCLNPRLVNLNPSSVLYFGHIAKHKDYQQFKVHLEASLSNLEEYKKQLCEQIYTNSKIAQRKYENVTWAMRLAMSSLLILLIELKIYLLL